MEISFILQSMHTYYVHALTLASTCVYMHTNTHGHKAKGIQIPTHIGTQLKNVKIDQLSNNYCTLKLLAYSN